jgi:hypothetical protein
MEYSMVDGIYIKTLDFPFIPPRPRSINRPDGDGGG